MNPILALETSSPVLSVALQKKKGGPVVERKIPGFFKHAENLLPAMDRLLRAQKIAVQDVKTWLIGRGPGSFTGVRIGFATLKGFLVLGKRSSFGAVSLDLIAENIKMKEGSRLAVLLDARRDKIYAAFYTRQKNKWAIDHKPEVLSLEDAAQRLCNVGAALRGRPSFW